MNDEILKLSEELFDKVLLKWRGTLDKSFLEYLDEALLSFNKDVKQLIEDNINAIIASSIISSDVIQPYILSGLKLDKALTNNSKYVKQQIISTINEYLDRNKTISNISEALFNGYKAENDLLIKTKILPKYIFGKINIDKLSLKTKSLQNSYIKLLKSKNKKVFNKNFEHALIEKTRYYANRIADTEEQRAFNFKNSSEMLEDSSIELVRFMMSSNHKKFDICDYYANLDYGYGKGILKKSNMIALPLHPHCHCRYVAHYKKSKKSKQNTSLSNYSEQQKIDILGSKNNLQKYHNGVPIENIFNSMRSEQYKIRTIKHLINS